ncbi:polymer-forming cytoskeletal protein [Cupriavidus sp. WKF15]|uniref:polymer-forming cytoskeletal protein n=1 Tax=Cupriavidus sp. WKF15 TaxID=3032282 RepID=UPI0023E2F612|nr:polymer-forming cytoskeletal protein [Cupriavidus sp. WKF15]WER49223.1 polymer-forming cytoskeletal protein [Cupriavidus sp. WKF15]
MMTADYFLLAGAVLGLLLLPFLPALAEWLRPTDFAPLPMRRDQPNSLTFFANGFRTRLVEQHGVDLDALRQAGDGYEIPVSKALSAGRDIRTLQPDEQKALSRALGKANHIVVFRGSASLAQDSRVRADLYVEHDFEAGAGTQLRACLAEGKVRLGEKAEVQRWVHGRQVRLASDARVGGRVTAEQVVSFEPPARFERAGAPSVVFGEAGLAPKPVPMPQPVASRQVLDGNADIGHDSAPAGDYVVRGDCRVAARLLLEGSIKSHGQLHVGDGARIIGSLSARKNMEIGAGSAILGPLIGFEDIVLGPNCRIGRPDAPTTLVCNRLFVSPGCIVHGVITTHEVARFAA